MAFGSSRWSDVSRNSREPATTLDYPPFPSSDVISLGSIKTIASVRESFEKRDQKGTKGGHSGLGIKATSSRPRAIPFFLPSSPRASRSGEADGFLPRKNQSRKRRGVSSNASAYFVRVLDIPFSKLSAPSRSDLVLYYVAYVVA